jgi:voltage-gated potassium channel Kch
LKTHPSLRQKLRYRFDTALSRGTSSLVVWLAAATLLLILVAGAILVIFRVEASTSGGETLPMLEAAWQSLVRTLDPGVMGTDAGWRFRIVTLLVTLGGVLIVSTLIGLLANGISSKIDELRKGKTPVIESGHTLILGWSPKVMTIISELMLANENQRNAAIVVMANEDKVFMEDAIRARIVPVGRTKVVCRTGNPSDPLDLEIVDPLSAKSTIVLNPQGEGADAQVIKTVLALMHIDPGLERLKVVAELEDERHARSLEVTTQGRIATVVSSQIIARITAQVCRQSGLSFVYQDLLDFSGDEIYFSTEPKADGLAFGEVLVAYDKSAVIGLRLADGDILLNPPMDTVMATGDSVIAISEDDDTVIFSDPGVIETPPNNAADNPPVAEHMLIIGWNALGQAILRQLDHYVAAGSSAHVLFDPAFVNRREVAVGEDLPNLHVEVTEAERPEDGALPDLMAQQRFDHIIVLCYREGMSPSESDAKTLLTLLQLRQITQEQDGRPVSIVTELLDVGDVKLAEVANPDDFIVSEQLVSLMIAQVAENPELDHLFASLFDADRAEIVLKPSIGYLPPGRRPFVSAVVAARAKNDIAIGYRKGPIDGMPAQVVLNPSKKDEVELGENDQLIVLSG